MTEEQIIEYCKVLGFTKTDFIKLTQEDFLELNWETIGNLIHAIYEQPRADHDMLRVNGDLECWNCGKPYWKHSDNLYYRDQEGQPYLKDLCGGILGKL